MKELAKRMQKSDGHLYVNLSQHIVYWVQLLNFTRGKYQDVIAYYYEVEKDKLIFNDSMRNRPFFLLYTGIALFFEGYPDKALDVIYECDHVKAKKTPILFTQILIVEAMIYFTKSDLSLMESTLISARRYVNKTRHKILEIDFMHNALMTMATEKVTKTLVKKLILEAQAIADSIPTSSLLRISKFIVWLELRLKTAA